tara:strand:- start:1348 stop:2316 length:969 start_codon:yes stop_codon:yes gene_type:complete
MFAYLIEKIEKSEYKKEPFSHIYIEDFFTEEDFRKITSSKEINLKESIDDEDLFNRLFDNHYRIVNFPGCVTNKSDYIKWHKNEESIDHNSACESAGMTLRLDPKDEFLKKVSKFFTGEEFNKAIAKKFNINFSECYIDGGIQKYLDGYEISPHPDLRRKAATFMVNINPHSGSEGLNHHTHYLKFNKDREYIKHFWEGNPDAERPWVPWDWCESSYQQTKNNSIVIFSPSNDTLHAVKADYDHLVGQRTQLYGNLWYSDAKDQNIYTWEDFDRLHDIDSLYASTGSNNDYRTLLAKIIPNSARIMLKKIRHGGNYYHRDND